MFRYFKGGKTMTKYKCEECNCLFDLLEIGIYVKKRGGEPCCPMCQARVEKQKEAK